MELWNKWMSLVKELEGCCRKKRTFMWLVVALVGFTTKADFIGVTSLARGVGLLSCYYTCLLNFFHSGAISLSLLQALWVKIIFQHFSGIVRVNGRCLIVGDGIKVGKEGKKMPAVKWLHQESESNSKAEFIMGHSIQAVSVLAKRLSTYFSIPLTGRIHEGVRFNCRDKRTQLDKIFELLLELRLPELFYFVADKYYCSGPLMKRLVGHEIHIITMMKRNAVAYYPAKAQQTRRRGRPKKYGKAVKLFKLFDGDLNFVKAQMPNKPGTTIEYAVQKLFWRPLGDIAQFVLVRHPERGLSIVMSTDLTLEPEDIILAYSLRFKIEVLFKQAIHQVGTFMYRFWLKAMAPRKRGNGDYQLHFAPKDFKEKVAKKISAYHVFIQLGFIAQGLMQYLSIHEYQTVWKYFGSWLRTIRENTLPSEMVVRMALKKTYLDFLVDDTKHRIFKKFLLKRVDIGYLGCVVVEKKEAA